MDSTFSQTITVNEPELRLLMELLEREQIHLPTEIRHTDARSYRHDLQERLRIVEGLLARLKPVAAE